MDIDNNGFFDEDTQRALDIYNSATKRNPLTDEQITEIFSTTKGLDFYLNFARAIEAAHGIKDNT